MERSCLSLRRTSPKVDGATACLLCCLTCIQFLPGACSS
jgi:hypothetical protein